MESALIILTVFNFCMIGLLLIESYLRDKQINSIKQYIDWVSEELLNKIRDDQEYLEIIKSNLIEKEKYKRAVNANKK